MTTDEWVGQTIADKYRVEALLGKGGMGLVLAARHVRLDEKVAIKLLLPAMLEVPGMISRFVREAQAASRIKSPHVARVTDVDVLPDGVPYMVMEYLDGTPLGALRRERGPIEIVDAVRYVSEACDAIAEAHSLGIVHRDLKPANLFLARGRDGTEVVKVLDFGISKMDAPGQQDTTQTGQTMGSPKYMPPEQMLSMHDVDARSDIWSLGAILYDLVAGRPPFVADTVPQLCSLVLKTKPPPPSRFRPDLPVGLEAVIMRCLEHEQARRFPNVGELLAALSPFSIPVQRISRPPASTPAPAGSTVSAWGTVVPLDRPSILRAQRRPRALALGVMALLVLAVGFVALWSNRTPTASSTPAVVSPVTLALAAQPAQAAPAPSSPRAEVTPSPAVAASPTEPSSTAAGASTASALPSPSSVSAAPLPLDPHRLRPLKKASAPAAGAADDPFSGKRR